MPPDTHAEVVLGHRAGAWVVRGRRGRETVVVRIEAGGTPGEGLAELAVLATVQHPGIAPLLDHGPLPGGGRYLTRAWIEGVDLLDWSRERSPAEIGRLVAELCPALDHLHREGFVHADLKPENVIVTPEGRPVIADFGLALGRGTKRATNGASGTLFAIAPEELLGLEITPAADLFALGAMLHRLLSAGRRSAREFYALFPKSSFLDAAGTDPEELPEWSRDLIVALTARDPHRRPRSAAIVGRRLGERLGVDVASSELADELAWPVGLGREAWLAAWMASDGETPQWSRVPSDEEPRVFWEHARLFAALRGRSVRGVDLSAELAELEHGVALDEWADRLAREADDWVAVYAEPLDAAQERGLACLVRACGLERAKRRRPRVLVITGAPQPAAGWTARDVPMVDEAAVRRFVGRHFPVETEDRRNDWAEVLAATARGSATRLDRILRKAARGGWILSDETGFRLRPGALPGQEVLHADAGDGTSGDLPAGSSDLLSALDVSGGKAEPDELAHLLDVSVADIGRLLSRARRADLVSVERRGDGRLCVRAVSRARAPTVPERLREIHASRASLLRLRGDEPHARVHAFLARTEPETERDLARTLAELRDSGHAELALELGDQLEALSGPLAIELATRAPILLVERGRAWCALGQTELALKSIEPIGIPKDRVLAARIELLRAQIASLRHETEAAFAHLDQAMELDPAARVEAAVQRIQLLHTLGRDVEVCDAVDELDPRGRESRGELAFRQRAFVESRSAMSAFALGRTQEAIEETVRLIAEAREANDLGLEAALEINRSILERRAGSLVRARESLEASIQVHRRAGLVAGLAHARGALGGLLRELGELVDAGPELEASMGMRERLNDREGAGNARGMLGLLAFERGHAREAVETLESTAAAMTGAQKHRFAPLLTAKAAEMRARFGEEPPPESLPVDSEAADPRILLALARIAWIRGDGDAAHRLAERADRLAHSLKLERLARESAGLAARLAGEALPSEVADVVTLSALDERTFALLHTGSFETEEVEALAQELERRGRDDRAARLFWALAARVDDHQRAAAFAERARTCFEACAAGLTELEARALRLHLLGEPDPWPGDFTPRFTPPTSPEEFEMEILSLFEINRKLVEQKDLETLLGVIVEHALDVTGAERGFLVLEEHGELRFDTALDSCRGDIAQPEFEISGSVVREALRLSHPIRVSNAVDDPELGHQTSVVSLELRSILCVPIDIAPGLRGAIYVDHRLRKGAFDERAEKLCALLADQAALAIQQMKRMEEIRQLNRVLERRVVERETDLQDARRALRAAGAQEPSTGLVGKSAVMAEVRELLRRVAPSDLPVLVTGASGTGKELAARSLHTFSRRSAGPFVTENCAALPGSLIESELFGFRRGAFTGADRDRAGLLEQAEGGTLFLDEIGELPIDLQAKLLRVLETGELRRLGDEESRPVDFRLVVATNRKLEEEVREGRFREDLFYRLDGVRVAMPPLAERPEDIAPLVEHFLRADAGPGKAPRRASREVLAALVRRAWPGNVRELRNEVSRLCVLCDGDLDDPELIRPPADLASPAGEGPIVTLAEIERRAILRAIDRMGGNKVKAAELLGISRGKIYQRLKEWREAGVE